MAVGNGNGGSERGCDSRPGVSRAEVKGSGLIGGSVGCGEENKENAGGYQSLLQQKLASRRKMVEEDVTGGSTGTVNFV
jgi:hypothetical protein